MGYYANNDYRNYLMHYGIEGMKWGVRRYQNPDGTLTAEGRARYGYVDSRVQEANRPVGTSAYRQRLADSLELAKGKKSRHELENLKKR